MRCFANAQHDKYAFTLAEVLITLVIIGVIAAITIPTLITKYQKEQTVMKLKKTYSTLVQAVQKASIDHGELKNWQVGTKLDPEEAKIFINTYLAPYLQIMKEPKTFEERPWPTIYFLSGNEYTLNGQYARFYLNDGSAVMLRIFDSQDTQKVAHIYIDINGDKKPNKIGRDIFQFGFNIYLPTLTWRNGKILPTNLAHTRDEMVSDTFGSACNKSKDGDACAAVILIDGWKISDDYPW